MGKIGRPPIVVLQDGDREKAAAHSREYRRRWGQMTQKEMAVQLGTSRRLICMIECVDDEVSTRLVAQVLALKIEDRPAFVDPKTARIAARLERERERDRAQAAWTNAGRPDSGPVRERMDAAYAAIAAASTWKAPEILVEHDPARRKSQEERKEDKDIPFT